MFVAGAIFPCPVTQDLRILGVPGKFLVQGMISTVRCIARAHCLVIRPDRHAACKVTLTPSASGVDRTH
jgi:hypothetical protein